MPSAARSRIADRASSSVITTEPRRPSRSTGQATWEGVAQLRPAMLVPGVSTTTGRPAASEAVAHAAVAGSTPIVTAGGGRLHAKRIAARADEPPPLRQTTTPDRPPAPPAGPA